MPQFTLISVPEIITLYGCFDKGGKRHRLHLTEQEANVAAKTSNQITPQDPLYVVPFQATTVNLEISVTDGGAA